MKKKIIAVLFGAGLLCGVLPMVALAGGSFYIDDITSFVGIGNTTPASRLDVSGAMYSRLVTASSSAIDWNAGNVQTLTLSSNPTLIFSNGQAGGKYDLILNQDSTGGRTVTWPASVKWAGGSAPVLTSSPNSIDGVSFIYDGANYLGSSVLNYSVPLAPLLTGLVGYWKLDESTGNASDSTGHGFTLTNNGSAGYSSAVINNGVDFGSSNTTKWLEYSANNLGAIGRHDQSAAGWVKITTAPSNTFWPLLNHGDATVNNVAFEIDYVDTAGAKSLFLGDYAYGASGGGSVSVPQTLTIGTWYYVAYTYNDTTKLTTLYLNGSSIGSFTSAGGNGALTIPDPGFLIGNTFNHSGQASASFDEVGFWDRVLTPTEISTLYNSGAGLQYPF